MKKSIYFSGIACAEFMFLGSIFKIQHWPGAGIFLTVSVLLFCFFFLPAALMNSYNNQEEKKYKETYIVAGIVFAICMMGVLFKVQHWPGAAIFLFIGIPLPFVLFLPVYLYQTRNENKAGNMNFSGIMFGLIFLAIFSVLLSLNVSKNVLSHVASGMSRYENSTSFLETNIQDMKIENKVTKNTDELVSFIENLKCEILQATDNKACENKSKNADFSPFELVNHDNSEIPKQILLGNGLNTKMDELKAKIKSFNESLLSSNKLTPELAELVNSLFDVSDKSTGDQDASEWEYRVFPTFQLVVVLDVLSQIQSNVRMLERECLDIK